jgi:hypothetical protein
VNVLILLCDIFIIIFSTISGSHGSEYEDG